MVTEKKSARKLKVWLPLLFSFVLVGGMIVGFNLKDTNQIIRITQEEFSSLTGSGGHGRVEELVRYIEAKYVDKIDGDELVESAINELLDDLDPHSNYITAKKLKEVNEQLEGNFEGVGIEFMMLEDTILVVNPIEDGPSIKAGILAGDKIISIEDTIIAGVNLETKDIIDKLRGEKGTKVRIGVRRDDQDEQKYFVVKREEIPLNSVDIGYMIDQHTGYIKINRFSANTYEEFMKELENLVEGKGMKNLVMDVRQNPGGYLQEATKILSQLFNEKNKLLVYTKGRSIHRNDYETTGKNFFDVGKIAVLIDEGSASASEIVAGAIQDWDRGVIVGRRSFGKGLVQEQYKLKDGSALRLTVARYFTPSGRSIQKPYKNVADYDMDRFERFENGEMESESNIHLNDTTKFYTANGRVVYGGGGISPDLFVPMDTIVLNDFYLSVRDHIPQFAYRTFKKHQHQLGKNIVEFSSSFDITDDLFNDLVAFANSKGIEGQKSIVAKCKPELKRALKARIARLAFKDEGYFAIWNQNDPVVNKALKALYDDELANRIGFRN